MLGRPTSPDFVGRGAELAALSSALERASGGQASAVFLGGESGVGKSRLVDEFASRAQRAGATVMVGACGEFGEEGPPYWPVIDALRTLVMKLDAAAVEDVLGPFRPELARLLPELAPTPDAAEEATTTTYAAQDRLFDLVLRVLHRLGERTPVVLVVEDLHWGDRSTRALISFLLANLRQARVLLVVTYRSDALVDGHFLHELMAGVHRGRRAAVLELARFTRDELEAQLAGILGMAPRQDVVDTIWARSEGNAFFAEELLAAVLEGRGEELPPSLRPILLARLEGLPEPALEVLRALAVGGLTVGQPLLAAVTPLDDAERLRAVRACVAHHLIVPDHLGNAYRFRHSLLREALYTELLPDERAHYHAAYGRALDERPEMANGRSAAERAYHWHAAGDFPRALLAAVDAGLAAERVYGFAEAQRHYERAIELWDLVPEATDLLGMDRLALFERAADAAHLAADHERSTAIVTAAAAHLGPDVGPDRVALLDERLGHYLWAAGETDDALAAYERAVERMPTDPETAELARVLGAHAQVLMLSGRYRESRERAGRALAVARRVGARSAQGHILSTLGFDLAFLGEPAQGEELLEQALAIAEDLGNPDDVGRAYVNLAELLSGPLNCLARAADVAAAGVERVRRLGLERSYGVSLRA
ncbi:MAG TPA: AAA family ATPase, partial [Acidimicrobiales bacterium]|nr:AAA family ATPase [Acidimicrobiales bacterium]